MEDNRIDNLDKLVKTIEGGVSLKEFERMREFRLFKVDTYNVNLDSMRHTWDHKKSKQWNLAKLEECNVAIAGVLWEFESLLKKVESEAMCISLSFSSGVARDDIQRIVDSLQKAGIDENTIITVMKNILEVIKKQSQS